MSNYIVQYILRVIEIFDTDSSETDFSLAGGRNGATR